MTKVKVFVYGRRQRRQQQRRGYDNSSPDFRHGELKITKKMFLPTYLPYFSMDRWAETHNLFF